MYFVQPLRRLIKLRHTRRTEMVGVWGYEIPFHAASRLLEIWISSSIPRLLWPELPGLIRLVALYLRFALQLLFHLLPLALPLPVPLLLRRIMVIASLLPLRRGALYR